MRLFVSLLLNALALLATAYLVSGFHVANWQTALLAAIVLGIINTFIKPILMFLTAPINFLTLGLFTFVVNAVVLQLAAYFTPGFTVDSFVSALLAGAVLAVVSTGLSMLARDVTRLG